MRKTTSPRQPSQLPQSHPAKIEPMEGRLMLAGDVWAGVVGGSLILRGNEADNHVVIDQSGLGEREFRVRGLDGTTVNGQEEWLAGSVERDIRTRLGGGTDVLELTDVAVRRNLVVRGGSGTDSLSLTGDGASAAAGVTFRPGYGQSFCTISHVTIGGLNLRGRGPAGFVVDHVEVLGRMSVLNRLDTADISLEYCAFRGPVLIATGAGDDALQVENSCFFSRTDVLTRSGADTVIIEGENSPYPQIIEPGSPADWIPGNPNSTMLSGPAHVRLGGGNDQLNISYQVGDEVYLPGRTTLDAGRGNDTGRLDIRLGGEDLTKSGFEHVYTEFHMAS